jgi:hypothetical protein
MFDSHEITKGTAGQSQAKETLVSWTEHNVVNPAWNSGATAYNAVANVVNFASQTVSSQDLLSKARLAEIQPGEFLSKEYIAQNLTSGLTAAITYGLAGKLTGGLMRAAGNTLVVETRLATAFGPQSAATTMSFLTRDKTSQILGAVAYDGLRDVHQGETRLGNMAGSLVGFSIFEHYNAQVAKLPLASRLQQQSLIGGTGATAQYLTSCLISGRFANPEELQQVVLNGAFMNSALPAVQHSLSLGISHANNALGRGNSIERYLKLNHLAQDSSTLEQLAKDNSALRVKTGDDAHIDHKDKVVTLPKNAEPSLLGHELAHGWWQKTQSDPLKDAAALLQQGNTQGAWQVFRQARLESELYARQSENRIIGELNQGQPVECDPLKIAASKTASGLTYSQLWQKDFETFRSSNGKSLPSKDFSSLLADPPAAKELPHHLQQELSAVDPWKQKAAQYAWQEALKTAPDSNAETREHHYRTEMEGLLKLGPRRFCQKVGDLQGYIDCSFANQLNKSQRVLMHDLLVDLLGATGKAPNEAFDWLQGLKPKNFQSTLEKLCPQSREPDLQAQQIKHLVSDPQAKAALRASLIFGDQANKWIEQRANLKIKDGVSSESALRSIEWIPLLSKQEMNGLPEWLLKNSQAKSAELEYVAHHWSQLSPEQKTLSRSELIAAIRFGQYHNVQHQGFAQEAAKWGVENGYSRIPEPGALPQPPFSELQEIFLSSQNTPSPFPIGKTWESQGLKGYFLPRSDVRGMFLGEYSGCCQKPNGVGADCAYFGQTSRLGGFFVVEDASGKIVAQSLAWTTTKGGLCFDNIESKYTVKYNTDGEVVGYTPQESIVRDVYSKAADSLKTQFGVITLGTKITKVMIPANWKAAGYDSLEPPFVKYHDGMDTYTDSSGQIVLAQKTKVDEKTYQPTNQNISAQQAWTNFKLALKTAEQNLAEIETIERRNFNQSIKQLQEEGLSWDDAMTRAAKERRARLLIAKQEQQKSLKEAEAIRDAALAKHKQ